jgi:hypothetical protein
VYDHRLSLRFSVRPEFEKPYDKYLELNKRLFEEVAPALAELDKHPASDEQGGDYALTERTCKRLATLLPEMRRHKTGHLSSGLLKTGLDADAAERAEWFVVRPDTWIEVGGGTDSVFDLRADRVKGRQSLRTYDGAVLASERWVQFVRDAKLSGVDFLWAIDKGKYAAPQWYTLFGTPFLGRAVDHPWFDPKTRGQYLAKGYLIVQPTDPQWLFGVRTFDASQLRQQIKTDLPYLAPVLDELRQRLVGTVTVWTQSCVLRSFLPETDFAYLRVAQPHEGDNRPHRTVNLCASAATRRKLIAARLAAPEDFIAVEVVDAPPPGVGTFDKAGAPLPGMFTAEEVARVRAAVEKQRAKFLAKPKPPMPIKPPDIAKLVPKLKRLLEQQGAPVVKGATPKAIEAAGKAVGGRVPERWAEMLSAVDGFVIDNCYALDGTAELRVAAAAALAEQHQLNRDMIPDQPPTHLGVASSDLGDAVFLDTSNLTKEGDCPVLFINHETLEAEATWPAIGLFLADALEPPEK